MFLKVNILWKYLKKNKKAEVYSSAFTFKLINVCRYTSIFSLSMLSIISLISSFRYSLLSSSIVSTLHTKTTRCGSDIVYISHSYVQIKNKCSRTHLLSIKSLPNTKSCIFQITWSSITKHYPKPELEVYNLCTFEIIIMFNVYYLLFLLKICKYYALISNPAFNKLSICVFC